jgi:nucleoside-diphosphate-sugar epimerase
MTPLHKPAINVAVTGAFGYSGRYITRRLLAQGHEVITLTNSLSRENPFGSRVRAFPFHFDQPDRLRDSLRGVEVLINTFWVRFDHRLFTHRTAIANTKILFLAARAAGVRRIAHVSITNPDSRSPLPYFSGKAELEAALETLGVSYCILRPTVLFGKEDVLINNIAWALRHLPVFGVFGDGGYRLQPIYVDDFAALAVKASFENRNEIINAVGPETFTYRALIQTIKEKCGLKSLIVNVPPSAGYWACRVVGQVLKDVVITREEIQGLMEERLYVDSAPQGTVKLTDWIDEHKETLGRRYTSEMARRVDRVSDYRPS